jgi:hypothetical protein
MFYIYTSTQRIKVFKYFQKRYLNNPQDLEYIQILKLLLDINNRWDSICNIMRRYIRLRKIIDEYY